MRSLQLSSTILLVAPRPPCPRPPPDGVESTLYLDASEEEMTGISSVAECVGRGRGRAGELATVEDDARAKMGGGLEEEGSYRASVRGTTMSFNSGFGLARLIPPDPTLEVPVVFARTLISPPRRP